MYNRTQLEEIAGDNVVIIQRPRKINNYIRKIKKVVCGRAHLFDDRQQPRAQCAFPWLWARALGTRLDRQVTSSMNYK